MQLEERELTTDKIKLQNTVFQGFRLGAFSGGRGY